MSSVLITGADGFLGRHIARNLAQRGFDIFSKRRSDGDVRVISTWDEFPAVNHLVHLAGATFVPASWENPTEFIHSNSLSTSHALEFCRRHGARMIFFSTYLYSPSAKSPISETDEIDPANPYALSKLLGEQLCSFYAKHFGVEVVILRPFNVFGSGQDSRFLIPSIIAQAKISDEIRVLDTRPCRDYVFIEDLLDAVFRAISANIKFDIFNVGTGVTHSVKDVIISLGNMLGRNFKIISSEQERISEIGSTQADIARARNVLGWEPRWTLSAGLSEVWNDSAK